MIDDLLLNNKLKALLSQKTTKSVNMKSYALKAAEDLKSKDGELLKTVHLKGENLGYYWSESEKKLILVPRKAEYYLLPWKKDEMGRVFLFLPHFLLSGVIIAVDPDEIDELGYN
ncbi:MAG TPA: hypothetical protein DCM40_04220 [Maribacter sp.]|nr:hypothetical protein [Maribacter sp.]